MPRSLPDVRILVGLVADCIESELYPVLSGPARYRARVALNVLRIVERELEFGVALDAEEAGDLQALAARGDGEALSIDALIRHIEGAPGRLDDGQLRQFLRRCLERALKVNNPRWLGRDSKEHP